MRLEYEFQPKPSNDQNSNKKNTKRESSVFKKNSGKDHRESRPRQRNL